MIYEGAVGIEILYTVKKSDGTPENISAATNRQFNVTKPDGGKYSVVANFKTDGTNGVLTYTTTQASELTPAGPYWVQPSFTLGLFNGRATPALFYVSRNK